MAADWPVKIDGNEYHPVPESWITAPTAYDHHEDASQEAVRLYAVSAALFGTRALRIRYAHLGGMSVLALETPATESDDGDGYYPYALETGRGWPRTYCPPKGRDPDDVTRQPEPRHRRELWGSRVDEIPSEEEHRGTVPDGGDVHGSDFDA